MLCFLGVNFVKIVQMVALGWDHVLVCGWVLWCRVSLE